MSSKPTHQAFVEHELRQAQPLFESVVDRVLDAWRAKLPSRLASDLDAPRVLLLHRAEFVRRAIGSLQEQASRSAASVAATTAKTAGRLELALVEDDEVTTDIEIARAVERANSALESEARELRTYTSALVGDLNTSRETNPLRPEAWVRALMAGARGVPISRPMQADFLRAASEHLIAAVGATYVAACARLQAQGVKPAVHRTIVNEGEKIELTEAMRARRELERSAHDSAAYGMGAAGNGLPLQSPTTVLALLRQIDQGLAGALRFGVAGPGGGGAIYLVDATAVAPGFIDVHALSAEQRPGVERLSQLFESIIADRRLPKDCVPLLLRCYPAALRFALADPGCVTDHKHAMWRFVDQLAFLTLTRALGDEQANLAFALSVVDQIAANPALEARHFESGIARIAVHERQRFARAVTAAADDIAELGVFVQHAATGFGPSLPQALDAGRVEQPDTTQRRRTTDLIPDGSNAPERWKPGVWLSLFLRGQWRRVLILWRAAEAGPLLMLDTAEARHWAVRRQSIERLAREGLAREMHARSLLRDAMLRGAQVFRESGPTLFG